MPEISFSCSMCQQPLEAPEEYANQVIECPACQKEITVPGPVAVPQEEAQQEEEVSQASGSARCPECSAELGDGVVLCLQCGFHTKLGKKIATDFK